MREEEKKQQSAIDSLQQQTASAIRSSIKIGRALNKYFKPIIKGVIAVSTGGASIIKSLAVKTASWFLQKAGNFLTKGLFGFIYNTRSRRFNIGEAKNLPLWKKHPAASAILALILFVVILPILPFVFGFLSGSEIISADPR